jgi:hypothetical protein
LWERRTPSPAIVASPVVAANRVFAFGYGNDANSDFDGAFSTRDADGDGKLTFQEYSSHAFMVATAKYEGDRDLILTRQEWLDAARATVVPSSLVAFEFEAVASESGGDSVAPSESWRYERSFVGVIPSALIYDGVIFLIKNGGILESLDAETGRVLKQGRIREAIEGYSASPVAADGKIYFSSEGGKVSVVKAEGDWRVISMNDLGEEIFATPALSGGRVFIRTGRALYCFGDKK